MEANELPLLVLPGLSRLPAGGEIAGLPEDPGIADGPAGGHDAVHTGLVDHPQSVRCGVNVTRTDDRPVREFALDLRQE